MYILRIPSRVKLHLSVHNTRNQSDPLKTNRKNQHAAHTPVLPNVALSVYGEGVIAHPVMIDKSSFSYVCTAPESTSMLLSE